MGGSVRLSGGDEGVFVKQTTRRTGECINSIDSPGDDAKGTGTSRSTLQLRSRLLLGRASEARRFATRNDIMIGIGL